MSYSEDKFRDHISAMVKKTEIDSERPLTLAELKELALDMGMVESEWDALLVEANDELDLAVKHLTVKNYMNAVESAERATSINPYIKDGNAVLAQAYYQLSILEKNEEYMVKAGQYAKRELMLDPMDATALHVLSAVENVQSEGRYSKKLFKYLGIGGAILVVLFLVIGFCNRQTTTQDVSDIVRNGGSTEQRILTLENAVEEKGRMYKESVRSRNNFLISWLSSKGNSDAIETIEEYDFDHLANSESKLKRAIGEAKATTDFNNDERIQLEGFENRMAVEKKKWIQAITDFNSNTDKDNKIDFPD